MTTTSFSPTIATSFRSSSHPLLNPKLTSSTHIARLHFSSSNSSLKLSKVCIFRPNFTCFSARGSKGSAADEELQARGDSSMPERFRYLYKEASDRPIIWPWAIALVFLIYAWRTVLWELSNWKKAALAILGAIGWLLKLALAFVFRWIGDPITGLIRYIELVLHTIRYVYASIVAFAPVPELTRIIFFTSTILAIAEAIVPDSVNNQPFLLTLSGIIGFGAVRGFVPEIPFWMFVFGTLFYSKVVKKRDTLSAALPSAALFAAVGEPWVRAIVITSYLALAIHQHAKCLNDGVGIEVAANDRRLPLPLFLASLAIGINLAAKWIRYRHLTWMIV